MKTKAAHQFQRFVHIFDVHTFLVAAYVICLRLFTFNVFIFVILSIVGAFGIRAQVCASQFKLNLLKLTLIRSVSLSYRFLYLTPVALHAFLRGIKRI